MVTLESDECEDNEFDGVIKGEAEEKGNDNLKD
jgi:hypothetical protein